MHHKYRSVPILLLLGVIAVVLFAVWHFTSPPDVSYLFISYLKMVDVDNGWMQVMSNVRPPDHFLRTVDGGNTWQDVSLPQQVTANGSTVSINAQGSVLEALNAATAWAAVGDNADAGQPLFGRVLRTDDGGRTWTAGNPILLESADDHSSIDLVSAQLHFVDSQHGWLMASIGKSYMESYDVWFQTSDGGMNWQSVPWKQSLVCDRMVADVCTYFFIDEKVGFGGYLSVEDSTVGQIQTAPAWEMKRTTDGGSTWTSIVLPVPADLLASSAKTKDPKDTVGVVRHFASFGAGMIGIKLDCWFDQSKMGASYYYLSADQGATWYIFPAGVEVFFKDMKTAWRFSQQSGGRVRLEKTTDGGVIWHLLSTDFPLSDSLQFVDAQHGWALVPSGHDPYLLHTADGGQTWKKLEIILPK
jgi:photosystem II stability/assembly factor-like uncharacterized protein